MITLFVITTFIFIATTLIYFRKYKKYKAFKDNKFFMPQVSLESVSDLFSLGEFGPTLKAEVQFMGRGDLNVPGGTSDTEAWILSVLAKKAKNMLEIGTCTGKTSYLMAKNSEDNAKVYTLTLPPDEIKNYDMNNSDDLIAITNAKSESAFTKFFYSGTDVENKIVQIFSDSKKIDENKYANLFDLIFIDGSHAYSYIKSDTEKCMKMLNKNGIILWHDYSGIMKGSRDVYKYLNEISDQFQLKHIKETTFVIYKKN